MVRNVESMELIVDDKESDIEVRKEDKLCEGGNGF